MKNAIIVDLQVSVDGSVVEASSISHKVPDIFLRVHLHNSKKTIGWSCIDFARKKKSAE